MINVLKKINSKRKEKTMKKKKKTKYNCEICGKRIFGELLYFEDSWLIHPENENPNCLKEAERQDVKAFPSK